MVLSTQTTQILRCPLTHQPLTCSNGQLHTEDNQQHYPIFNGLPWLIPNPMHSISDWQIKISLLHQQLQAEAKQLMAEADQQSDITQQRLKALAVGKSTFAKQMLEISGTLLQHPLDATLLHKTLSDQAPRLQSILSYQANIYRDWVWGAQENQLTADIVLSLVPEQKPTRLLMPGIGAGRLLYDVYSHLTPERCIGTDINPFTLFLADHMISGQSCSLYEFPTEPIDMRSVAIEQKLQAANLPNESIQLIFANLMTSPFQAACFDLVITPWLIDIVPSPLPDILSALNQLLPVGGHWINFGSLVFHHHQQQLCYSLQEIMQLARSQGFEIEIHQSHEIPYLKSPHNAGYRMENIWCWRAIKTHSVPAPKNIQVLPDWLLDTSLAVPDLPAFNHLNQHHVLFGEVLGWANGQLSLKKMAARLSKKYKVDKTEAENTVIQVYRHAHELTQTKSY